MSTDFETFRQARQALSGLQQRLMMATAMRDPDLGPHELFPAWMNGTGLTYTDSGYRLDIYVISEHELNQHRKEIPEQFGGYPVQVGIRPL